MDVKQLPILGISGFSGSGKTTLIVELVRRLNEAQLKVAVVKHSSKCIQIDTPGKDSDRFFAAGAHVYFTGQNECFSRLPNLSGSAEAAFGLLGLARSYDLVLVEGYKHTALPKIWLKNEAGDGPPADVSGVLAVLDRDNSRCDRAFDFIQTWLFNKWLEPDVYGCILIGGNSSRMGRPKHLIEQDGKTWLQKSIEKLDSITKKTVVVGAGEIPQHCNVERLPDAVGVNGPIAGMLAAMRWNPWACWLVMACDMPYITDSSLRWLLDQRKPGSWAIMPTVKKGFVEPLFAYYDFRVHNIIEKMIWELEFRPGKLAGHPKSEIISPPGEIQGAWKNLNFLQDLESNKA